MSGLILRIDNFNSRIWRSRLEGKLAGILGRSLLELIHDKAHIVIQRRNASLEPTFTVIVFCLWLDSVDMMLSEILSRKLIANMMCNVHMAVFGAMRHVTHKQGVDFHYSCHR